MTIRILGVVAVFGLGVGIGCAAAPLVVPKASAQQAATLTKWEYECAAPEGDVARMSAMGAEGWEAFSAAASGWCFKRPKM